MNYGSKTRIAPNTSVQKEPPFVHDDGVCRKCNCEDLEPTDACKDLECKCHFPEAAEADAADLAYETWRERTRG